MVGILVEVFQRPTVVHLFFNLALGARSVQVLTSNLGFIEPSVLRCQKATFVGPHFDTGERVGGVGKYGDLSIIQKGPAGAWSEITPLV